jgi:hypothetical protein
MKFYGRETVGDFKKLNFNEQVATIANDIKEHFWHEDAKIIANSFRWLFVASCVVKIDSIHWQDVAIVANRRGVFKRGNQHGIYPTVC